MTSPTSPGSTSATTSDARRGGPTGTTVVLTPPTTVGGCRYLGGGAPAPASSELLSTRSTLSTMSTRYAHRGQRYGLAAADGVTRGRRHAVAGPPSGPDAARCRTDRPAAGAVRPRRGGTKFHTLPTPRSASEPLMLPARRSSPRDLVGVGPGPRRRLKVGSVRRVLVREWDHRRRPRGLELDGNVFDVRSGRAVRDQPWPDGETRPGARPEPTRRLAAPSPTRRRTRPLNTYARRDRD